MQKRRAQGLCFNCDEKFTPGHKCKGPQLLLLEGSSEYSDDEETEGSMESQPEISLHALIGWTAYKTMRVANGRPLQCQGRFENVQVLLLRNSLCPHSICFTLNWAGFGLRCPLVGTIGNGDGDLIMELEAILDTRWVKKGSKIIKESLIKWKRLPVDDATWENTQEMNDKFENMNLEDKVPAKGEGIDKPRRSQRVPTKNPKYFD
ncbi:hypothetical protein EZV62_027479 [Acer yangbiense]|uniref:Chromo domain-containing protein n=1 Tax=Acer yangbiense TaxID=1000413 RepID=A0A5C7GUG5_9ROSI|nr:hypothetical protein EZV62_027479 [Acer yangbiense]